MASYGTVLFVTCIICSNNLQVNGNNPSVVSESTVAVHNPFVPKCFAYPVKIYAFPDNVRNDGLDSITFERYDGPLPTGSDVTEIGFQIGSGGQVLSMKPEKGCRHGDTLRTGAFSVTATSNSASEEIVAIVNPDLDLKPVGQLTYTISQSETADLEVEYDYPSEIVWIHNGHLRQKWQGELKITVSEAGIYQAFSKRWRHEGRITFRVIKRACIANMWGSMCDQPCPASCTVGAGVCDDTDGSCICAPGRSTTTLACDTVESSFGFGDDNSLLCEKNGLANPGCRGILFCLRDPYGCSCMTGFGGVDCSLKCPDGMYGPNCDISDGGGGGRR